MAHKSLDVDVIDKLLGLALSPDPNEVQAFETGCVSYVPQIVESLESIKEEGSQCQFVYLLPKCFAVLKEYSYENVNNTRDLVQRGVIALVFDLVRLFPKETDVFVHACGLLVNLSVLVENRALIVNAGAIPVIVSTMKEQPTEVDVQKMGSMMIRNLCCDSVEYQELAVQENAIPFLIETSIRHLQKWDVLEQSIAALSHITINEKARAVFIQTGGIPLMVAIGKSPKDSPFAISTYTKVVGILVNLSLSPSLQKSLVEGDCFMWMRETLMDPSVDPLVTERILLALGNIACDDVLRGLIVQNGAVIAVLRIISDPGTIPNTVRIAMWALVNFIINSQLAFEMLLANDGTERLINVMQTHLNEPETLQHSAKVMLALTREAGVFSKEMAEEGMAVFLSALNVHSKSPDLTRDLCSLLVNITRDINAHKIFHMEEGIGTIAEVLELHYTHFEIFSYCCRILANVVIEKDLQFECKERGVPGLIVAGMKAHPLVEEVQIKGCQLVAILATQNASLQDLFAKLSLVQVIVANYRQNLTKPNVLKYYFSALLNLSMSDNAHPAIAAEGGIDIVREGMHKHTGALEIQTPCIRLLGNMVGNDAMLETFSADVLQLVVNVMITHITNRDIVIVCCWILEEITNHDSKMDLVEDVQGLKAVRLALVQHLEDSEVLKRGLEIFINYSSSPYTKHRAALTLETLVMVLNMLAECPPTTQELCCIIMGNIAATSPSFIRDNAVPQRVSMALATHPADVALQIEGLSCLCKCAVVTGDLSPLEPLGGVEVLAQLLRAPSLSPNLKLALYRAVQALSLIPQAVVRLASSGAIEILIAELSVVNETVLLESGVLSLAYAILFIDENAFRPMVGRLTGVVLELIASTSDAVLAAALFLLVGNAFVRGGILPIVFTDNNITNIVTTCYDRCTGNNTPYDLNTLRLICGYTLSAIFVINDTTRKQVLRSKRTTDLIWHAAQDLVANHDLQKEYQLKADQLRMCRQALDILLDNQMALDGQLDVVDSRPTSSQVPAGNRALFDRRKEAKQHRATSREAIIGSTDIPGPQMPHAPADNRTVATKIPREMDNSLLTDVMTSTLSQKQIYDPIVLGGGVFGDPRPQDTKEQDQMVFEALEREQKAQRQSWMEYMKALRREKAMWEEQEEFERGQLESEEYEARRLLSVRFVQHQKAVVARNQNHKVVSQKANKSMESTAATHMVELAVGTEYLRSVMENPPPARPAVPPPKPPANANTATSSASDSVVKVPSVVAGEIPAAGIRRSDFVPARPKFVPKVNQVVGWESLAAQYQQHKNDAAIASASVDPLLEDGGLRSWQERGELVKFGVTSDPNPDPAATSPKYMRADNSGVTSPHVSLPRYIYLRNGNATGGGNSGLLGQSYDMVRSVAMPNSSLSTSPKQRRPFI